MGLNLKAQQKLGTRCPGIMDEAIKSGNIFDPAQRAEALNKEWEMGAVLLAQFVESQAKVEAQSLRSSKIEEISSPMKYGDIKARLGEDLMPGWSLHVEELLESPEPKPL